MEFSWTRANADFLAIETANNEAVQLSLKMVRANPAVYPFPLLSSFVRIRSLNNAALKLLQATPQHFDVPTAIQIQGLADKISQELYQFREDASMPPLASIKEQMANMTVAAENVRKIGGSK